MEIREHYDTGNPGEEVSTLWDDYRNGRAYQSSIGLTKKLPLFVRFYEGDQWPKPTKNTKNLPRPVINIIKMFCRNKKSAILSTPVKICYKADNEFANVEKFNRFAAFVFKKLGQDALDKEGVGSGVKKGAYFYHYYWDAEAGGKHGSYRGGLRAELIDPLNIFFADPTERDEQKQKWILIASREELDSVRAKCDKDVDPLSIKEDEPDDPYNQTEQEGSRLVTVLTRYFRRNGEVYIEKATKNVIFNKAFPLTPDLDAARAKLRGKEDAPNNGLPDRVDGNQADSLRPTNTRAYLYPIVVGNYEEREKCIYGLGEIEGLIQNQRSINFNVAMMLLAAQQVGMGKYVVTKNALNGQEITNAPGEVLTDYSGTGNGIKRMSEPNLPTSPMQIVDSLTQMTRVVTGSSEIMTGEAVGANMSGAAIAQIQSQALQPVEDLKNTFWKVKEKQGLVLAQFFKLFYTEENFSYVNMEENGAPSDKKIHDKFNSREFAAIQFEVVVEATGGTNSSVAGDINALEVALNNGGISLLTFFELYPKDALSNREEILKKLRTEEGNKVGALQSQIEALNAQLQQAQGVIAEQKKTVDQVYGILSENQRLKTVLAEMYTEAARKISDANQQILMGNQKLRETSLDATAMARFISDEQGLSEFGLPGEE